MKPRFRILTLLVATAVVAYLVMLAVDFRNRTIHYVDHAFDSHLLINVGALTCEFLADHENQWPAGWIDFEPYVLKKDPNSDLIRRLQERIDFDFSPGALERVRQATEDEIVELRIARPIYMDRDSLLADLEIYNYFHAHPSASSAHSAVNP